MNIKKTSIKRPKTPHCALLGTSIERIFHREYFFDKKTMLAAQWNVFLKQRLISIN